MILLFLNKKETAHQQSPLVIIFPFYKGGWVGLESLKFQSLD
jgi:hypothetical protein